MRVMVLEKLGGPLAMRDRELSSPGPGEVRIRVEACAVCRTDLHVIDGELPGVSLPIVPGHQIVGRIDAVGSGVTMNLGDRVGVTWLAWTCGDCPACSSGHENLCRAARFTGYQRDGGFADACIADARFVVPMPDDLAPATAAPLLCGATIGYRALRFAGPGKRLGLYGFGSAAHMIAQIARFLGHDVYAFTRPGDADRQRFARRCGAVWAAGSDASPPEELDSAIIFAADGSLVPRALAAVAPGGTVVCAGIHMSEVPAMPYRLLWGERVVRSVANVTREDATALMRIAPQVPLRPHVVTYSLAEANRAIEDLRAGRFEGSAVLVP